MTETRLHDMIVPEHFNAYRMHQTVPSFLPVEGPKCLLAQGSSACNIL